MKKVDVIMNESLKSIIGPSQTIKRIIKNKEFFYENGYEINVYTADDLSASAVGEIKKKQNKLVKKVLAITRWLALHSKLYGRIRLNIMFNSSKPLLEYYMSKNNHPDIMVFHSLFDCYDYLVHYQPNDSQEKICLFTHSDGFVYNMLLSYFPRLKGTSVEAKMEEMTQYVMNKIAVKPCIARIEETNLLNQYKQLTGKTCLVINGIDDLELTQLEDIEKIRKQNYNKKYRFVCTGSINGRKGQGLIIEALHETDKEILNEISVTFIGDGPERITLEDKVEEYGLQSVVRFTGPVPNTEVYRYLAEGNIGILMSAMEGLPISLIECIRSGLPLVSTNVSGIPELIDQGKNGVLLNCNKEDLKDLFTKLDAYDWAEMGKASRKKFVESYTFVRMRADYLNMLKKASTE